MSAGLLLVPALGRQRLPWPSPSSARASVAGRAPRTGPCARPRAAAPRAGSGTAATAGPTPAETERVSSGVKGRSPCSAHSLGSRLPGSLRLALSRTVLARSPVLADPLPPRRPAGPAQRRTQQHHNVYTGIIARQRRGASLSWCSENRASCRRSRCQKFSACMKANGGTWRHACSTGYKLQAGVCVSAVLYISLTYGTACMSTFWPTENLGLQLLPAAGYPHSSPLQHATNYCSQSMLHSQHKTITDMCIILYKD